MKTAIGIFKRLFALETIPLTIAILGTIIVIVLDMLSILPPEVEKNAVLFLLGLIATGQLIDRVSILPRLERSLNETVPAIVWAKSLGLERVYRTRSEIKDEELINAIVNAQQVDLLGVSLGWIITSNAFTHRFLKDVRENRRKLRLILLNPSSKEAKRREIEEGEKGVSNAIRNWLKIIAEHLNSSSVSMDKTARLYEYAPSCLIIRADDVMYVVNYVFGLFGESPTQKIQNSPGGLFEIYMRHFEQTWKHSRPYRISKK